MIAFALGYDPRSDGQRPRRRSFNLYVLLGAGYLLLLIVLMAISVGLDIQRAEQRFFDQAHAVRTHFEAITSRYKNTLHGFAALLEIEGVAERDKISNYARSVLATQTDIYMLEVVQKVSREQLPSLIDQLTRQGFPHFGPKYGEGGWLIPAPPKPWYYLVTFMEPMLPQARDVLGIDFESTAYLRNALFQAIETRQVGVSRPFRLIEGQTAYLLLRSIEREGQQLFAVAVCKLDDLLPPDWSQGENLMVELSYGQPEAGTDGFWLFRRPAKPSRSLLAWLFPTFSVTYPADGLGQPFQLKIQQSLDLAVINFSMLGLMVFSGLSALPVLVSFARAHHRREMKRLEESNKLFYLANFDSLTDLPNRQLFLNRLEQALAMANRQGMRHAILFLDLDGFKAINDYYGHRVGDRVLQRAAGIIKRCVREVDTVARLGGDEFVILLLSIEGRSRALRVAEKIKRVFDRPIGGSSRLLPKIGASIGVALFPDDGKTAAELLNRADQAMYADKSARKSSPPSTHFTEIITI